MTWLLRGISLLEVPSIRKWAMIPLVLNLSVYAAMIGGAVWGFSLVERLFEAWLPPWLHWLAWLLWPLFLLLLLVVVTQTFTTVANLVASPFNGLLAEQVQRHLTGETPPGAVGLDVGRALRRQLRSMMYAAPPTVACAFLFVIPGVNVVAPVVWFALSAWMSAVQYVDYVSDNNLEPFADMLAGLRGRPADSWGFGLAVAIGLMVPLVNLLVMPAAVAGATEMWLASRPDLEGDSR